MDRRQRLQEALQKRDQLREKVSLIKGKLEAARSEVVTVEEECLQRKVNPAELDSTIQKLQARFDESIQGLEERIQTATAQVGLFTSDKGC